MIKIGVTGGIGSGKTLVCNIFRTLGIPVFNADEAAKNLLQYNRELRNRITEWFQFEFTGNVKADNKILAGIVFKDKKKLRKLNTFIHPLVMKEFDQWCGRQTSEQVILEAAILVETGLYKKLDLLIAVGAPEKLRVDRAQRRDKVSAAVVRQRMKMQGNQSEIFSKADFVIKNDGDTMLLPRVIEIYHSIVHRPSH